MTLSKSIILIAVAGVGLAAGTLLVAGYADKPQAPAPAACTMKCEKCPLPADETCCQADPASGCTRPKACPNAGEEKSCGQPSAEGCPREALATPQAQPAPGGCPMGGCPHAQ